MKRTREEDILHETPDPMDIAARSSAEKVEQLCECTSMRCLLAVEMTLDEVHRAREGVIIVDGCPRGPDRGAKLLGGGRGYKVYEDRLASDR